MGPGDQVRRQLRDTGKEELADSSLIGGSDRKRSVNQTRAGARLLKRSHCQAQVSAFNDVTCREL